MLIKKASGTGRSGHWILGWWAGKSGHAQAWSNLKFHEEVYQNIIFRGGVSIQHITPRLIIKFHGVVECNVTKSKNQDFFNFLEEYF